MVREALSTVCLLVAACSPVRPGGVPATESTGGATVVVVPAPAEDAALLQGFDEPAEAPAEEGAALGPPETRSPEASRVIVPGDSPVRSPPPPAPPGRAAPAPPPASAPPASAPPAALAAARSLYQDGAARYASGDYHGAADAFRKAYALVPMYQLLWNIARAELSLGRTADACRDFARWRKAASPEERARQVPPVPCPAAP